MANRMFCGLRAHCLAAVGWTALATSAFSANNDIVINEIMYHVPNERDDLQYIELFNRGQSTVDVANWSLTKGVKFVFPENTKIEAGSYLVVCRNRAAFSAQYGKQIAAVGNFS